MRGGKQPGGGRRLGSKNKKTIEKDQAREAFRQLVLQRLKPIFEHQYSLVKGTAYLYRIVESNGGKEQILVTDPDEIGDVIAQMDTWEGQVVNDQYYYITVRAPENSAIKDMLDRALDKAIQPIGGDKDNPLEVVTVVKYAK